MGAAVRHGVARSYITSFGVSCGAISAFEHEILN